MSLQIPEDHEVDSLNERLTPLPVPQPPFYKNKGFWKAALPGIIVLFCMAKGYWSFLAVISMFAVIGSVVGAIALALGKNSKWRYCLGVLALSLAVFIAGLHFDSQDAQVASDHNNAQPNSKTQAKQTAAKPIIPADVKTSELLPDNVEGYTIIQRQADSTSPQKHKGAQEESYLVLQPTTDNPHFHSIASAELYVAKFDTNSFSTYGDEISQGYETIKAKDKVAPAAAKKAGTPEKLTSSSCYVRQAAGNYMFDATISMKPDIDAAGIYQQSTVFAPFLTAYLEKVIKVSPSYAKAYKFLAGAYYEMGKNQQAFDMAERGIQLSPKTAQMYNVRGLARENLEGAQAAIDDFNRAIALEQNTAFYCNRGGAYIQCKQYDQALQDLNKSIELNGQSKQSYYWRAIAYKEKGEKEDAIADSKQALKIDPKYQAARNLLAELQE